MVPHLCSCLPLNLLTASSFLKISGVHLKLQVFGLLFGGPNTVELCLTTWARSRVRILTWALLS